MSAGQDAAPLAIGRIDKAHGIRGEVLVTLTTNRLERVEPGAVLYGERSKQTQTFVVAESRPHQHRFLVRFDGYRTRNEAEELRGFALSADPIDDPDEVWVHDLIGAAVTDPAGVSIGTVASVEASPASDLLILEDEQVIPLTFFVEITEDGTVIVDPPDGLFEEE